VEGLGLGLWEARRIVEEGHKGKIWLASPRKPTKVRDLYSRLR
jgi:signal transduction histidine kinase